MEVGEEDVVEVSYWDVGSGGAADNARAGIDEVGLVVYDECECSACAIGFAVGGAGAEGDETGGG